MSAGALAKPEKRQRKRVLWPRFVRCRLCHHGCSVVPLTWATQKVKGRAPRPLDSSPLRVCRLVRLWGGAIRRRCDTSLHPATERVRKSFEAKEFHRGVNRAEVRRCGEVIDAGERDQRGRRQRRHQPVGGPTQSRSPKHHQNGQSSLDSSSSVTACRGRRRKAESAFGSLPAVRASRRNSPSPNILRLFAALERRHECSGVARLEHIVPQARGGRSGRNAPARRQPDVTVILRPPRSRRHR